VHPHNLKKKKQKKKLTANSYKYQPYHAKISNSISISESNISVIVTNIWK